VGRGRGEFLLLFLTPELVAGSWLLVLFVYLRAKFTTRYPLQPETEKRVRVHEIPVGFFLRLNLSRLAVETLLPASGKWQSFQLPAIRTIFSLTRLAVADT
jgi:hypothetical protein